MLGIKKLLNLVVISFITFIFIGINFAQEGEEVKPEVGKDTTAGEELPEAKKGYRATYNAMELVKLLAEKGINGPTRLTVTPDGVVYVIEDYSQIISAWTEDGTRLFHIGGKPAEPTGEDEKERVNFKGLTGIGSDDRGNLYVTDYKQTSAFVLTPKGDILFKIPMDVSRQKKRQNVGGCDIKINSRGDIYVTDCFNGVVSIYNMNGQYKYAIQKFQSKDGKKLSIIEGGSIAISSIDDLYVLDALIFRVHRFNAKGNYLGSFGGQGDAAGMFTMMPNCLTIDSKDRIYVLEPARQIIQVYDPKGGFLYALSDPTGAPLDIAPACAVYMDRKKDYLYVSQPLGVNTIKVFKYHVSTGKVEPTGGMK